MQSTRVYYNSIIILAIIVIYILTLPIMLIIISNHFRIPRMVEGCWLKVQALTVKGLRA